MIELVLLFVAFVLGLVVLVQARLTSLVGWALVLGFGALLLGRFE